MFLLYLLQSNFTALYHYLLMYLIPESRIDRKLHQPAEILFPSKRKPTKYTRLKIIWIQKCVTSTRSSVYGYVSFMFSANILQRCRRQFLIACFWGAD